MRRLLLSLMAMGLSIISFAQSKDTTGQSTDTTAEDAPYTHFNASLDFLNNYVYVGRPAKDIYPYLTPALTWYHKSGAYVGGSVSFLTKKTNTQVDLVYLTAGYDHVFGKFEGNLEVNKYWYNKNSSNPKSDIGSDITATGTYDLGIVNVTASAFAMFSSKTDWGATLAVGHSFYFLDEALEVAPAFQMNSGSTKYYPKQFAKLVTPPNANGVSYLVTADLSDAARFKVLDYELSAPVSYHLNSFTFSFTPTYAFPVKPATAIVYIKPSNAPPLQPRTVKEHLNNVFFFALDVEYEF